MGIVRQGLRDIEWFQSFKTPAIKMQDQHPEADQFGQSLVKRGVKLVVFGAHAANRYNLRPRSTVDIDFLCQDLDFVEEAANAAFPDFQVLRLASHMLRVQRSEGQEIVDFVAPVGEYLPRVFEETVAQEECLDAHGYYFPRPEFVLAMKFASMINPERDEADQYKDASDFIYVVRGVDQAARDAGADPAQSLDIPLLIEMGNAIYPEGGAEITRHISDVRAGKRLQF